MKIKRSSTRGILLISVIVVFALSVLIFCLFMVNSINREMNESAKSSLLNTTRVIEDTLERYINRDLESLRMVVDFRNNGDQIQEVQIRALCETMGFDWIGIVDAQGKGADCFTGRLDASDLPCYDQWVPGEAGYSDVYIGDSGRSQIMLWVPTYQDGVYEGTIFGSTILTKYYSANVFTFYEGEGRTYLFDGSDGTWILKSLGTDGVSTRQPDIYSLLTASGNKETNIKTFQQMVEEGKSGAAVFDFNGESSYLCFLPLSSSPDWYVVTVIAKEDLLRESAEVQRTIRWVLVTLCLGVLCSAAAFVVWRVRKTREEEAYYRETLFANISANLDSAFLIYDKNQGETVFVSDNVKRLLGLDRDWLREDAGHLFDWCKIPKEDPQRIAFLKGTMEQMVDREVCVENELGENARFIRLELIQADLGQEIAVLTDITKDKQIQCSMVEAMERAEAASNAKNEFMSAMSHDLRTPINGVMGMTAIAAAHLDNKDKVKNCLTKISESTAHLLSLINEVLDMTQIESGKIELSSEPFNLAELVQDILNMNYPGIQQKNHTVNIHIHLMEHEEVIGDSLRLKRVAANLISNAIKYTPSGGTITMTLQEKPSVLPGYGCYELMVQDNGLGMSPEFQEKLFQPFEREEDVRVRRIQGTGLGMSIVKSIVTLMMGDIEVESEKGKGTTFKVTVNLLLNEQSKEQDKSLAGIPVLVVDDDAITCETVTEILCDMGMTGEWTQSGAEAVEKVLERHQKGEDYLAVLLDFKMPEMDGYETARRIRSIVDTRIPIIMFTGYELGEIEVRAREAGVDAFLSKPIYKAKLSQKMAEIAAGEMIIKDLKEGMDAILPGRRVLLAEDNELNTEIATELLQMLGIKTDCAENGAEAVRKFAESDPGTYDMILMDIQMPKMNGYDATRAIRSMERPDGRTIPIVAMTADAFKRDEQAAYAAGMDEHLAKPISLERLKQVLTRFFK